GGIVPLFLLYHPKLGRLRSSIALASSLVIVGGLAQVYVIIIGGQAYPLDLFPGMVVSSSFYDGVVNSYTPSLPEITLGVGGVALSIAMVLIGVKVLRFLPRSLADAEVDPHHTAASETASGEAAAAAGA
ncbi:MAG: molybdopterin oxidoreductase, partial [Gammaproteobacteria bacterium]